MNYHQCLAAGTLVTTPDGDKKIEDVKAGDLVLGGVGEGMAQFHEVKEAKSKTYSGPLLEITTDFKHKLRVTPNHICFGLLPRDSSIPFRRKETVVLQAYSFWDFWNVPNHEVYTPTHTYEPVKLETNLDCAEETVLAASRAHGGAEIERVAMFCGNEEFEGQPFNFLPASQLKINNGVPAVDGKHVYSARIKTITEEQYDGLVYDLDIPESRNFAANGVLVHNSKPWLT